MHSLVRRFGSVRPAPQKLRNPLPAPSIGDPLVAAHAHPLSAVQLEEDPTPLRNSQAARAASLVISCLKFCQAVRTQARRARRG